MEPHQRIHDYEVYGASGEKIGKVDAMWADRQTDRLEFIGVKTGWLSGKHHVVPANEATIDVENEIVRIPFTQDKVKDAPTVDADRDIPPDEERRIYSYYGLGMGEAGMVERGIEERGMGERMEQARGDIDIPLSEEELHVGKREVPQETVHLRKIVRTEPVTEDIELRREELEIDRVPAQGRAVPEDAFRERDYEVSSMREEPVVEKEAHLRERVRAHKEVETEHAQVKDELRKEDVEVDRGEAEFRDRS